MSGLATARARTTLQRDILLAHVYLVPVMTRACLAVITRRRPAIPVVLLRRSQ